MAGKKNKTAKSGAATVKAAKLPKTIAGIKVPKELRKSGAALLEKANSPVGREVIAAGITAIVAAAVRSQTGRNQAGRKAAATDATVKTADKTGDGAAERGAQDVKQVVDAIGAAAGAVMQRLFEKKAG